MADRVLTVPAQCYFRRVSTTVCRLEPYNGKSVPVKVGGVWRELFVPSAGVDFDTTGLSASTWYYAYVYDNGGSLAKEWSATAYAVDADSGVPVKSGDATRTLVGAALTNGSTQFAVQGQGCISWWNPRRVVVEHQAADYYSGNSASYAEVNSAMRLQFMAWAHDRPHALYNTSGGVNSGADQWLAIYLDGSTLVCEQYGGTAGTVFMRTHLGAYLKDGVSEASHYVTLMRKESATQYIGGNQTTNKMTTVAQVCVMG